MTTNQLMVKKNDVLGLNPTLEGLGGLPVNYIAISKEDPLAFKFSDRNAQPRTFVAHILGGRPRFSAKSPTGEWQNFADYEALSAFVGEHPDWQEVRKYILALRLPDVNENYVFGLPFASAIAFWTYTNNLAKENIAVASVWTRFSIERVARRSDASAVYSRVSFAIERPLTDEEAAKTQSVKPYDEDEANEGKFDQEPFGQETDEQRIRRENEQAYTELIALPFGKGKASGQPKAMSREAWDGQIVTKYGAHYSQPIFGFSDLGVEDQKDAIDHIANEALHKGLLTDEQSVKFGVSVA